MIGYFTPLEDGELLYSALARTADILFPGKGNSWVAERFLGSKTSSIGCFLPNNCTELLAHIPKVSGIDRESILDASIYHAISPFLLSSARAALLASLFESQRAGERGWLRRQSRNLKYCVLCAREDDLRNRPQVWRVLPNHPAVTCCPLHKVRLVETGARLASKCIHSPAKWISLTAATPDVALPPELHVASDVSWLLQQRSAYLPGYEMIAHVLRGKLLSISKYSGGTVRLNRSQIQHDIRNLLGDACRELDPRLPTVVELLPLRCRESLARYSLLGYLANTSFAEVVAEAVTSNRAKIVPFRFTREAIETAKRELVAYVRANPFATRMEIRSGCRAAIIVLKKDAKFYSDVMPRPRPKGVSTRVDWSVRDLANERNIKDAAGTFGINASSVKRILRAIGMRTINLDKLRPKLPRTWAAANEIKGAWISQRKKAGLSFLLRENLRAVEGISSNVKVFPRH